MTISNQITPKIREVASPRVAILLASMNGAKYIDEQLQSYLAQTYTNWSLNVSDDGSSDLTREIIAQFARSQSRLHDVNLRQGPALGFSRNFMSLAEDKTITGDYFAFSDQDDIWYSDKLDRALNWLQSIPSDTPALYCSRTEIVDQDSRHLGLSPLFKKEPSFQNALVQNIGGGNTMVFNASTKRLFELACDVDVVSHDWWAYQAVSAAGGQVFYDPEPSLKYRQHGRNQLGSNNSLNARLRRIRMLFTGTMRDWNALNIKALQLLSSHFEKKNRATLENFISARESSWSIQRLFYLVRSGVYRQTTAAQLSLITAAVFGKV